MAEQVNWRDLYEDKDSSGDEVVELLEYQGTPLAYFYRSKTSGNVHVAEINKTNLVPKPKPKSYRPFTVEEFKEFRGKANGVVWVKHKPNGEECLIERLCGDRIVAGNYGYSTLTHFFNDFTFVDGTPFGILE